MADVHGRPRRLVFLALTMLMLLPAAARALDPEHPAELTPLLEATEFPRCTVRELALAGFPDRLHAWTWSDWQAMVDADSTTYGPRSLCTKGGELLPREGLLVEPDHIAYGQIDLRFNPGYTACQMMLFVEISDWAARTVPGLLGLAVDDTLRMVNPDNTEAYQAMSGQGTWRLYQRRQDDYLLQPIPILYGRTLDGHASFMIVTDWVLHESFGDRLPLWLHVGLVQYVSEYGVHLVNFMAQFRNAGPILLPPPIVDGILAAGVDPDSHRDREMFRRAAYSAFLMVWQLVENEGGLESLRDFLQHIADGEDLDSAATEVYGVGMADLQDMLDPVTLGEPIGTFNHPRRPQIQP